MFAFRVLHTVPYSNEPAASDLVAMLHSFITSNLLVAASLVISFRQFGGNPIDCMVPTEFTPSWTQYAEMYCWAQESYFVPFTSVAAGLTEADKKEKKVSYYQWMPFFLLFEAACFRVPCLIWKYFASQSGMRIGEIIRLASSETNGVPEVKKSNVEALGVHLNGALRFHKILSHRRLVPHKFLRFLNVKYSMHYVTFIYFVAKTAFLLNVGLQIRLLQRYVLPTSIDEHLAVKTWHMLMNGNDTWMETGIFPRVTLCDLEIREMGNLQTHTVQCLLLMNVFTEKIFLILWTWYMVLAAFTALNLFSWAWIMISETSQMHFIMRHLEMSEAVDLDRNTKESHDRVGKFVNFYLGSDGVLILTLVATHADVVFTTDLIAHLWSSFCTVEQQRMVLKHINNRFMEMKDKMTPPEMEDGVVERKPMAPVKRTQSIERIPSAVKRFDESSSDEEEREKKRRKSRANSKDINAAKSGMTHRDSMVNPLSTVIS